MKVYIPNISKTQIGGGFTFLRNFKKALDGKINFVSTWQECDIIFIFGITTIDKSEIHEAVKAGKKLVLRVDNIPRKSRNRRQSPAERLKEFGELADVVVYQSEWCKDWAGYFAGDGIIINNGVDTSIFNKEGRNSDGNTFLYIDYNPNPFKRFDEAIYKFERYWRKDNDIHLIIAGNAPKEYLANPEYNWDLNVPAKVEYAGILETPEAVAEVMKKADYLLYPSFAEAYPNIVLEALSCGVIPKCISADGGVLEIISNSVDGIKTIEEMGQEYLNVFKEIINEN